MGLIEVSASRRRALLICEGDSVIFFQGPAAQTFTGLFVFAMAIVAGGAVLRARRKKVA